MSDGSGSRVAVLMGSDSDLPVMAAAVQVLERLGIGHEVHVTSAHRSPERTIRLLREAPGRGVRIFIVGAGSAAHLAGVAAAHTTLPVLGVPLAASELNGLDALLATVQMPAGIPVGTLAIGKPGAANAAWLAAAILALDDEELARRLADERRSMAESVERKDEAARRKLPSLLS
jgi:5-(carboxyamino)imidazole ribonucleotide mutase